MGAMRASRKASDEHAPWKERRVNCPSCGSGEHKVHRTTETADGCVRRLRDCITCGKRWATMEVAETALLRAREIEQAFRAMRLTLGEE